MTDPADIDRPLTLAEAAELALASPAPGLEGDDLGARVTRPPPPRQIRYPVERRDIPAVKAARRMHLSLEEFRAKLPELLNRGFPAADPTTGMFFLPAIDKWMEARHGLTARNDARDDSEIDRRLERARWGE
jgi:hypothetical protein